MLTDDDVDDDERDAVQEWSENDGDGDDDDARRSEAPNLQVLFVFWLPCKITMPTVTAMHIAIMLRCHGI